MISLRSVSKRYGDTVAVRDLSLEIASGELCMFVGPSGCGKTTTLKMINRLIDPTSGAVLIDGENVLDADPVELRRHIGYVMQQGGLFPHLRIGDNVATVPRLLGWKKDRIVARVEELLTLVGLDPARYAKRYPHELSGGERQRVGVARALGGDPPILLMDEPFGAVDPIARRRLQEEFIDLQARLNKTVVFVTHDIDEAIRLGTKIAILRDDGQLSQYDTPENVVREPASAFVAQFVGIRGRLDELGLVHLGARDVERIPSVGLDDLGTERTEYSPSSLEVAVVRGPQGQATGFVAAGGREDGTVSVGDTVIPLGRTVNIGDPLDAVLAQIMDHDERFVGVMAEGEFTGVVTLDALHSAMRRTAGEG
ncbi:MAG TPA: ABC transporter ATP-binding protein [Acidimicrobiales bacterium]|jgi:osmoprotectant transport system ATP-binding protein|nr:ABC transporter ATP-binding protein [Acidimicrobiales bacterium]